ncbi:MAG: metalloregulator ArsR/SmtB family transcription factor [Actinomycetota bacterium]|nr:metalloregulator ArsR/SmtB family transcription factor [Actinomycetota bacterium]
MIADALGALADPTRRRVFELVAERSSPVGEIAAQLPVSRPAVSQHLKVLRLAGLVQEERLGARHLYRLDPSGLESVRAYFDSFWQRSLAAFQAAVEQHGRTEQYSPTEHKTAEEAP